MIQFSCNHVSQHKLQFLKVFLSLFIQCSVVILTQSAKPMCIGVFYMIKYVQQIKHSVYESTHLHLAKNSFELSFLVSNVQTSFEICMFCFCQAKWICTFFFLHCLQFNWVRLRVRLFTTTICSRLLADFCHFVSICCAIINLISNTNMVK